MRSNKYFCVYVIFNSSSQRADFSEPVSLCISDGAALIDSLG